tara:strand:- start:2163 stop:2615 length:453 start_codon:yes stop_codon:yes gene_type:complete
MIQSNELRIGNLVLVENKKHRPDLKDKVMVVSGINTDRVKPGLANEPSASITVYAKEDKFKDSTGQWIEYLKPIQLTREILDKIQECRKDSDSHYIIDVIPRGRINIYLKGEFAEIELGNKSGYPRAHFLHNLQNIFHSLSGQELTFKAT